MAGQSVIFRVTNTNDTEGTVTDKIEFNGGLVPDDASSLTTNEFELRRALGVQTRIKTPQSHKIKDTGFQGLSPVITGVIRSKSTKLAGHKWKTWLIEDQDSSLFPFGRFGLRLDDTPEFNMVPKNNRGYYIENVVIRRPEGFPGRIEFTARLRFDGNVGTPNTNGQYVWN